MIVLKTALAVPGIQFDQVTVSPIDTVRSFKPFVCGYVEQDESSPNVLRYVERNPCGRTSLTD